MSRDNCSLVGYISKPHGASGDVNIRMNGYDAECIEPGESMFVEIDGTLIPFFITESTPKGNIAVIHLEFIDSVEEARKFSGKNIYLPTSILTQEKADNEFDPSMLAGFHFTDTVNSIEGEIIEYLDNPSNPLFLVKTTEKEFLIPAHPDIITFIDETKKIIIMKLPEGIADI